MRFIYKRIDGHIGYQQARASELALHFAINFVEAAEASAIFYAPPFAVTRRQRCFRLIRREYYRLGQYRHCNIWLYQRSVIGVAPRSTARDVSLRGPRSREMAAAPQYATHISCRQRRSALFAARCRLFFIIRPKSDTPIRHIGRQFWLTSVIISRRYFAGPRFLTRYYADRKEQLGRTTTLRRAMRAMSPRRAAAPHATRSSPTIRISRCLIAA